MSTKRIPAEDRRAAIMAAVRPLVARKGLGGTSTKEMAAAAGVSEALIYRHFPSKQALLTSLAASIFNALAEDVTSALMTRTMTYPDVIRTFADTVTGIVPRPVWPTVPRRAGAVPRTVDRECAARGRG